MSGAQTNLMVLLDLFDGIKVWDDAQLTNLFRDHASIDVGSRVCLEYPWQLMAPQRSFDHTQRSQFYSFETVRALSIDE
jgi:hypothetical protein